MCQGRVGWAVLGTNLHAACVILDQLPLPRRLGVRIKWEVQEPYTLP